MGKRRCFNHGDTEALRKAPTSGPARHHNRLRFLPVGRPGEEAGIELRGIGRQAVVLQRFFDAVIPRAHFGDFARFLGRRHFAAKCLANAHDAFDLLDTRLAFAIRAPKVVLVADTHVLPEHNRHRGIRDEPAHAGPDSVYRTLRHAGEEVHHVKWIAPERAAAVGAVLWLVSVVAIHTPRQSDNPRSQFPARRDRRSY